VADGRRTGQAGDLEESVLLAVVHCHGAYAIARFEFTKVELEQFAGVAGDVELLLGAEVGEGDDAHPSANQSARHGRDIVEHGALFARRRVCVVCVGV
jgi:hypothetical protein